MFLNGYCQYVLVALFPLMFSSKVRFDLTSFLVLLFSFIYTLFTYLTGETYTLSALIFGFIYPILLYQVSSYIVNRNSSASSSLFVFALMAFFLNYPAVFNCIKDTIDTGEIINVTRMIFSDSGELTRSATGYGMALSVMCGSVGMILLKARTQTDMAIRYILIIGSIGALFSVIHLVNRTGLVLAFVSIILAIATPPISTKKVVYTLFSLTAIIIITSLVIDIQFIWDIADSYESRETGGNDSSSYGGRTELWSAGLQQLYTQPLGNPDGVYVNNRYRYAHNLWIDCGINGGLLSLLILLAITFIGVKALYRSLKMKYLTTFEKAMLLITFLTFILQSSVEPVLKGLPQFFWLFLFFIGIIHNLNNKYKAISMYS